MAGALAFGALGPVAFFSMFQLGERPADLGSMSRAWLAEYHAARR